MKTSVNQRLAPPDMKQLLAEAQRQQGTLLRRLEMLVAIESPSSDKAAVDRALSAFGESAAEAGGVLRRHAHREYGDSLEVRFGRASAGERPILLLGHLDTVWDIGTLRNMPWRVTDTTVSGPGVLDMKAGVLMALSAIETLHSLRRRHRPIIILLHGDEEVGSPASRQITETVAKRCSAVYVLEPGQGDAGAYKTARKAVGMYRLTVHGIASHSGVDFERGHSAVVELARQIAVLTGFTDLGRGITVNPGLIGGGTRSNVVAAEAWAEIDVRLSRSRDLPLLDRKFRSLKAQDARCRLELTGGINRPPMERTAGTVALFRRAKELAAQLRVPLSEASTGGGSDGNFTSALGIPTLDGMGAVGAGAHAAHEHLSREHLAPRTALLAAMLT